MKMTLGEVRQMVRQALLVEVQLLGGKEAAQADIYRVYELQTSHTRPDGSYGGYAGGKFIVVPYDMPKYGKDSLDDYMRNVLGLNQDSKDKTKPWYTALEDKALVVNHRNKTIETDVAERSQYNNRRPGKRGGGSRSYMIPHASTAFEKIHELQKILKAVKSIDPRLTDDYKIVGNPNHEGKTVGDIMKEERPGDVIVKGGQAKPMIFYHGTSDKRLANIKKNGLAPGNAPFVYADLVKNYSEFNVYLTTEIGQAENYATRAAVDDGGTAVILKVIVRDPTKFVTDEDNMSWTKATDPDGKETEIHFKHDNWKKWPNANQIMAKFQQRIASSLNKSGAIAYRGKIPVSDISVEAVYKPASMSKDPDWEEYKTAREKTLNTYTKGDPDQKRVRRAELPTVSIPKASPTPEPAAEPVRSAVTGGKTYKIYGRLKGAPAHTRLKGKAYVAGPNTKFKPGEQAAIEPAGDKLKVKKTDSDHSQLWDPE